MFGITILMSSWSSACLLATYNIFPKMPRWTENMRNAFIILNFFFPLLLVFSGWLSNRLSRLR